MVTRDDGLSATSLVLLDFEFQKSANVGTQAMPLENTEAQRAHGIRAPESLPAREEGGGEQGSLQPWDQIKVELLSLTWLFGSYHLCREILLPSGLKQILECGSEIHSLLAVTRSRLLNPRVTGWQPGAVSCQQACLVLAWIMEYFKLINSPVVALWGPQSHIADQGDLGTYPLPLPGRTWTQFASCVGKFTTPCLTSLGLLTGVSCLPPCKYLSFWPLV